jgi:NAD(P)H-dependent FMN reductase
MKLIISGTNRSQSRTRKIADLVHGFYKELNEPAELVDLREIPLKFSSDQLYTGPYEPGIQSYIDKIDRASGLVIVCPEYNGSYPGALKFFIDHWSFPRSFEFRPVCFIGLGGRYGGLRPIEHLQQVFGYRNAFIYPQRVFLFNIWDQLKAGNILEENLKLLKEQAAGFVKYVEALEKAGLDANTRLKI